MRFCVHAELRKFLVYLKVDAILRPLGRDFALVFSATHVASPFLSREWGGQNAQRDSRHINARTSGVAVGR